MSKLKPEERKAFARDLLELFVHFEADVTAACLKHAMAPNLFAAELDFDGLKRELQAELDRP
jgi:hypothetical protein